MNTMGHLYGKLKHLDLLQVQFDVHSINHSKYFWVVKTPGGSFFGAAELKLVRRAEKEQWPHSSAIYC